MTTSSTVAITLDMGCCRCRTKIQKILCCLQERCRFVFEKVVYEKDKVLVSGTFDAVDLCCTLRCKARCFATKIEIVLPEPEPKPEPEQQEKKKKKKNNKEVPATNPPPSQPEPPKCNKPLIIPYYPPYYPYSNPCPNPPPPRPLCPPTMCNKCPIWMPCQCRGYPWVVCCEEPADGACAVM